MRRFSVTEFSRQLFSARIDIESLRILKRLNLIHPLHFC